MVALQLWTLLCQDIGANIGWFTINAAARGYEVIAFEGMRSDLVQETTGMF